MNLPTLITDNVTELLVKIIEFTQTRQKILIQNINGMQAAGFVPKDLGVAEFSKLMHEAIDEHSRSRRLLLRDGQTIKFGASGSFETRPVVDEEAKRLFEKDRDEYLRIQISKLMENSLNQGIALELLRQKQGDELSVERSVN